MVLQDTRILSSLKGHEVQIKMDLCDVTLSCEDKQMMIHRLIISSYSSIDDLSVTVVTKHQLLQKKA